MRTNGKKGVTLMALVITIVVLTILAGTAVGISLNRNNLFGKANHAKEEWKQRQESEDQAADDAFTRLDTYNNSKKKELHIGSYEDLLQVANRVNAGESLAGYRVYLESDIAITDNPSTMIGVYGGGDFPSYIFAGIFDGGNHTISGVNGYALFLGNNGTIKNLNIIATISGNGYHGSGTSSALCAENSGNIQNCNVTVTADISSGASNIGAPSFGGICGSNNGTINKCKVSGTITGMGRFTRIGGISGINYETINNCTNEATITAYNNDTNNSQNVGGIVGENAGEVYRCVNVGDLDLKCLSGGGIVGQNCGTINECINKGNISADGLSYFIYLGGICGYNLKSSVINCYNTGSISLNTFTSGKIGCVSGIVPYEQEGGIIENCYTTGAITLTGSNNSMGKAAFHASSSIATNCFYNIETCVVSDDVATGKTTAQMKYLDFITSLGGAYESDHYGLNNGLPILKWQRSQ